MKRYARIDGGTVVEIIEGFERTEAMRPPMPEPLTEGVDLDSREALAHAAAVQANESFVLGEVPIAERFSPSVVASLIELPEDSPVAPGFTRKGKSFRPPEPVVPPAMTAAEARAERDRLMAYATAQIAPLEDAVEMGEASTEEKATLAKWKKYRLAASRTSTATGWPDNVQWPALPA